MNFTQAMGYLEKCQPSQMTLGLEAITELLSRMDHPEKKLKFIHVGGTNGKGSTAAFLSSILVESGLRVGRYISPTIIDYCERIQVSDKSGTRFIEKDSVAGKITKIKEYVDSMQEDGYPAPSPFELETVLSFLEFIEQKCDIVVLEVGLGGRLDATNVIDEKELCILCSISMDHMAVLGNSLEEIAKEKAGIIIKNTKVVAYDYRNSILNGSIIENTVKNVCEKQETSFQCVNFENLLVHSMTLEKTVFSYETYEDLEISLLGKHQARNAVLALESAKILREKGYSITDEAIYKGLKNAKWRGRLELVSMNPMFIVDGAHNEDAAKMLMDALTEYFPKRKLIMIMGAFVDKEYEKVLRILAPKAKELYVITAPTSRGLSSTQLKKVADNYCDNVIDAKELERALNMIDKYKDKDEVIVAFGSLSFLHDIFKHYKKLD